MKAIFVCCLPFYPIVVLGQAHTDLKLPFPSLYDSTWTQASNILEPRHSNTPSFRFIDDTESFGHFPGGDSALRQYIQVHSSIFDGASKSVRGILVVNFDIDVSGKISKVNVLQGLDASIDRKAVELIAGMPNWVWDKKLPERERHNFNKTLVINFDL